MDASHLAMLTGDNVSPFLLGNLGADRIADEIAAIFAEHVAPSPVLQPLDFTALPSTVLDGVQPSTTKVQDTHYKCAYCAFHVHGVRQSISRHLPRNHCISPSPPQWVKALPMADIDMRRDDAYQNRVVMTCGFTNPQWLNPESVNTEWIVKKVSGGELQSFPQTEPLIDSDMDEHSLAVQHQMSPAVARSVTTRCDKPGRRRYQYLCPATDICARAGTYFETSEEYKFHRQKHHQHDPWVCAGCSQSYSQWNNLCRHYRRMSCRQVLRTVS